MAVLSAGAHPIQTANVLLNKAVHFLQRPGQTISRSHSDFSTLLPVEKALSAVYSWTMAFFMSLRWQWTRDACNQFCLLSLLHMQPPIYVHVCVCVGGGGM